MNNEQLFLFENQHVRSLAQYSDQNDEPAIKSKLHEGTFVPGLVTQKTLNAKDDKFQQ